MKTRLSLLFSTFLLFTCISEIKAQWTPPTTNTMTIPNTIDVGIGLGVGLTPKARLSFDDYTSTPLPNVLNGISWSNSSYANAQLYGIYRTNNGLGTWAGPEYQQLKLAWQMGIVLNPGTASTKSFVDVQGGGLRVTAGKLFVGEYDASSSVNKASISFVGAATSDAIAPLIVSKKITGTSNYRRFLFIPHNIGSGYSWITNDGDFSIIAHNTVTASGIVIAPSTNSWAGMRISGTGNVGIATNLATNPNNFTLGVAAANLGTGSGIWVQTNSAAVYGVKVDVAGSNTKAFSVYNGVDEKFRVDATGRIWGKELYLIYGTGDFADYVFAKEYKLKKLEEVEAYINQHSHLPNFPSAAEVSEKGIGTAEMQNKLLEKIEELTLYLIQQDKKIKALEVENKMILESIQSK